MEWNEPVGLFALPSLSDKNRPPVEFKPTPWFPMPWATDQLADFDKRPTQWIDIDSRLGSTGAATFFMQMSIGVMGSHQEGGTSVAINLRNPAEASIVFISPPPEDKRQEQISRNVFKNNTTAAIDPANYTLD